MADQPLIPLRFQRSELETKAELTPEAVALMTRNPHPGTLIAALADAGLARDAVHALALMLPHRQVVWWACLAVRALPDLDRRPAELAAVAAAERWVQNPQPPEAETAGELADAVNSRRAAFWVATAAAWTGPSLAPRGQMAVPPAPYLPGLATRTALILLMIEPALEGRVGYPDWLVLGRALMHGDTGLAALAALRQRLVEG